MVINPIVFGIETSTSSSLEILLLSSSDIRESNPILFGSGTQVVILAPEISIMP